MDFFEDSRKQADDVTVSMLKQMCEEMYQVRDEADALEKQKAEKTKRWRFLERKIIDTLNEYGMTNFDMGEGRKIGVSKQSAVDLPQDRGQYEELMNFIHEHGHDKFFFTLNKTKLRSFVKTEREGRGDEAWLPPGVVGEETTFTLSMRGRKRGEVSQ